MLHFFKISNSEIHAVFKIPLCFILIFTASCSSYDITQRGAEGNTLLHEAVLKRDISLAGKLINRGYDLQLLNNQSLTPLQLAARLKEKDMVQLFISSGAGINYETGY